MIKNPLASTGMADIIWTHIQIALVATFPNRSSKFEISEATHKHFIYLWRFKFWKSIQNYGRQGDLKTC